jgi:hypothetical protein
MSEYRKVLPSPVNAAASGMLGTLSPKANADDVAATEKVEGEIADGKISDIPTTVN